MGDVLPNSLPLTPDQDQATRRSAALLVATFARDAADCAQLLDALGLTVDGSAKPTPPCDPKSWGIRHGAQRNRPKRKKTPGQGTSPWFNEYTRST
jgi:hypothetical protein